MTEPVIDPLTPGAEKLAKEINEKRDKVLMDAAGVKIAPEERYFCQGCDKSFAKTKPNGNCINCFSDKVIDRTPDVLGVYDESN